MKKSILNWIVTLMIVITVCFTAFKTIKVITKPHRPDYIVTRINCNEKLNKYMRDNELTTKDVAKQLGCSIREVELLSRMGAYPTDETIAKVEALILTGPPKFDDQTESVLHDPLGRTLEWARLYWPFPNDNVVIVIHNR